MRWAGRADQTLLSWLPLLCILLLWIPSDDGRRATFKKSDMYPKGLLPSTYSILLAYCQHLLTKDERPLSARGLGFLGHRRCHRYVLYCSIGFTAVRRFNMACPIGLWWSNQKQSCLRPDMVKNVQCHVGLCGTFHIMPIAIVPDYRKGSCFAYYECRNASHAHLEFCENSHKFSPLTGACEDVLIDAHDYCTRPEPLTPCHTKPFLGNNVIFYNADGELEPCSPGMVYSRHYCKCVIPELE